jgi:hypothetical protein
MSKDRKHHDLYYLLPGMGRGARARSRRNILLGVGVGLFLSGIMWLVFSALK